MIGLLIIFVKELIMLIISFLCYKMDANYQNIIAYL